VKMATRAEVSFSWCWHSSLLWTRLQVRILQEKLTKSRARRFLAFSACSPPRDPRGGITPGLRSHRIQLCSSQRMGGSLPACMQTNHPRRLVAGLDLGPALVDATRMAKSAWARPTRWRSSSYCRACSTRAATPVSLHHSQPAHIRRKWRRVQLLRSWRREQRRFAASAAQLVLDELRPILDRAMHAPGRAHHGGLSIAVRSRASPRIAVMRPRLVNLAARAVPRSRRWSSSANEDFRADRFLQVLPVIRSTTAPA